MKGILTPSGCEAESDDGTIKYILRKMTKFPTQGMEQTVYNAAVFVRVEGNSWQQSMGSGAAYLTVKEFIQALANAPGMGQAYKELTERAQ